MVHLLLPVLLSVLRERALAIDWGVAPVLCEVSRVLNVTNRSPIPAEYTLPEGPRWDLNSPELDIQWLITPRRLAKTHRFYF